MKFLQSLQLIEPAIMQTNYCGLDLPFLALDVEDISLSNFKCKLYLSNAGILFSEEPLQAIGKLGIKDYCSFCNIAKARISALLNDFEIVELEQIIGLTPDFKLGGISIIGAKQTSIYQTMLSEWRLHNASVDGQANC